jgi:hypothetical protein
VHRLHQLHRQLAQLDHQRAASPGARGLSTAATANANASVQAGAPAAPLDSAGGGSATLSSKHKAAHAKLKINRGPLALGTLASRIQSRTGHHHRLGAQLSQSAARPLLASAALDEVIGERGHLDHHRH